MSEFKSEVKESSIVETAEEHIHPVIELLSDSAERQHYLTTLEIFLAQPNTPSAIKSKMRFRIEASHSV